MRAHGRRPRPCELLRAGTLLAILCALIVLGLPERAAVAQESGDRRVFSFFYYWYEPITADLWNVVNHTNLSNHHPSARPADWRSVEWFKGQFSDMNEAGIDVALTVYWGNNLYPETPWSTIGLSRMVQALDEMAIARQPVPKLGLFFDTYVLDGANLTDPERLDWLTAQVRAYYRLVPARHRALQDGRPIIWLYLSNFANDFDQQTFEQLGERLRADLGGARPYWVADVSWRNPTWTDDEGLRHFDPERLIPFDAFYRWGAASAGMLFANRGLPIASVGPGYDDSAIAIRGEERTNRGRDDGCFYANAWRQAQRFGAQWVVVETWNELYEGSGIAETAEWGRDYITATTGYSGSFRTGQAIQLPARCSDSDDVAADNASDPFFSPAIETTSGTAVVSADSTPTPGPTSTPTSTPSPTPSPLPDAEDERER